MASILPDRFAAKALEQIGNDGTKYLEYFGISYYVDWCVYFVRWCACQVNMDTTADIAGPPYVYNKTPSSSELLTWYRNNRRDLTPSMSPTSNNRPVIGDIVFIENDNNTANGVDHVGIVTNVSDTKVTTVEGNLGSPGIVKQKTYTNFICDDGSGAKIVMLGSNHKSY